MECKIFTANSRIALERQLNEWLPDHPVTPDSMRFEFSTVVLTDQNGGSQRVEHTLVLFYVPMRMI